jgi:hypothetical protein
VITQSVSPARGGPANATKPGAVITNAAAGDLELPDIPLFAGISKRLRVREMRSDTGRGRSPGIARGDRTPGWEMVSEPHDESSGLVRMTGRRGRLESGDGPLRKRLRMTVIAASGTFVHWRRISGHPFAQGFDVRLWPDRLTLPLRWRKPRRVSSTACWTCGMTPLTRS